MTGATRTIARRRLGRVRRREDVGPGVAGRLGAVAAALVAIAGTTATLAVVVAVSAASALTQDLPDPAALGALTFAQPTIVYDRDRTVELGRFQDERRAVVTYEEIPRTVLDATTTAEDRTFWQNSGVDVPAIVAAVADNASGVSGRGASTITQQLVRARLLPDDLLGDDADRYTRKVKEILQALRVSEEFPGEVGKERIISAYLNEIYYGHGAYGIAAAADVYFGVNDLAELTIEQAALLAGLPKSPSNLDPYRYAEPDDEGRLVVPADAEPVVRRDWILRNLPGSSRWTTLTQAQIRDAVARPVVLVGDRPTFVRGGHFTWQVRRQLESILPPEADLERDGYRVITTLDWDAQRTAERWLAAAAIAPNVSRKAGESMLRRLKIPKRERGWIRALRGKDLHNASLVALDYRTGDVLAYVGSAGYARDDLERKEFDPKYDAAGVGARQPGSAFKPILYASAFDNERLTPASVLLDITTEFDTREDWAPTDADQLERGPVLVRRALQYSLNIPAIRALERTGSERVADTADALGLPFMGGRDAFLQAGLAGALGTVEVRPLDLTSAYGTIANGGVRVPPRMILEVLGPDGSTVWRAPEPEGERAISAASAFLVTSILAGNTDARQNPIWAEKLALFNTKSGDRRPAAVKTGTANDARDLATYGYLAPARDGGPALAVGIWMGNSDHSYPQSRRPATSLTAAAPLWRAFMRDYTKDWPIAKFSRPKAVVEATVDAWSGGRPGPWTRDRTTEWFVKGTQPGAKDAVDRDGLLYSRSCGGWRVDPLKAELGPAAWNDDVASWMRRARGGQGVRGRYDSRTAYFWGERSWGGPIAGPCVRGEPPRDRDRDRDERDRDQPDDGRPDRRDRPDRPGRPDRPPRPQPTGPPPPAPGL